MHDSHIHLALEPLKSNCREYIEEFEDKGGIHILAQSAEIEDWDVNLDIKKNFSKIVDIGIAIHPTYFEENTLYKGIFDHIYDKSLRYLDELESYISKNKEYILAIGETGLDYYQIQNDNNYTKDNIQEIREIQKVSLSKHINIANKYDMPISIHARDMIGDNQCVKDTIEIVAREGRGLLKGSFHSYTGDLSLLPDILDLGFCVGFNAIITYNSGENVRAILKETPLERILFETDGPFLPPQSVRKDSRIKSKFAKPIHIQEIIEIAAEIKGIDKKKMEEISDSNYERVFFN